MRRLRSFLVGKDGRTIQTPKPKSKYGAVRTTVDGIKFDSKKEAKRYGELKLLEKVGEIEDLKLQPRFRLLAASTTGQVMEAARALAGIRDTLVGEYRADFSYLDFKRGRIVEDVKSPATRTALYKWKKRHTEIQYGIEIIEV